MSNKTCITCKQDKTEESYRAKRGQCRECERERQRAWYAKQKIKPHQRPEMKQYFQRWYANEGKSIKQRWRDSNSEVIKKRAKEWAKANPVKRRSISKENMLRQREKLSNAYVRRMLAESLGLKSGDIPQQLVDVQRELLKLKRELRNEKLRRTA